MSRVGNPRFHAMSTAASSPSMPAKCQQDCYGFICECGMKSKCERSPALSEGGGDGDGGPSPTPAPEQCDGKGWAWLRRAQAGANAERKKHKKNQKRPPMKKTAKKKGQQTRSEKTRTTNGLARCRYKTRKTSTKTTATRGDEGRQQGNENNGLEQPGGGGRDNKSA